MSTDSTTPTELRPGVLLDLDGTLVDTNYLHTLAWHRGLRDIGEWAPMNAIHRLIGMGGDELVPELMGREIEGASDAWNARYRELIGELRPFPQAAELVQTLRKENLATVLATSSPQEHLETALADLGGFDAFDAVTNSDDVERAKPAPDVFLEALKKGDVDRERAYVVGDSVWDVAAAEAAGLPCIGLESGGFSRYELNEAGAVRVYRDARQLLEQLHTSPLATLMRQY